MIIRLRPIVFLLSLWMVLPACAFAQQKTKMQSYLTRLPFGGFGIRFASDFTFFYGSELNPLTNGTFSTGNIGLFYKQYYKTGLLELGATFCYKESRGGFALPLVMQNFSDLENTAFTSAEIDFKVGPRIWYFYPKFGVRVGYRFKQEGFLQPDAPPGVELNRVYAMIPMGIGFDFPTGFGTTGFSVCYNVGINDVISKPDLSVPGRQRSVNFEIHVTLQTTNLD